MKKVKLIYFPVVFLLILVLTVFSFYHVSSAGSKSGVSEAYIDSVFLSTKELAEKRVETPRDQDQSKPVRDVIINKLKNDITSSTNVTTQTVLDKDGEETDETEKVAYYREAGQETKPAYFVQTAVANFDTVSKMKSTYTDEGMFADVGKEVNNIIVHIPGSKTKGGDRDADVILLTTHIDPVKIMSGSEDATNTTMIAVMLEEIEYALDKYDGKNDLVFLFADARYQNNLGLHVFINQFRGFRLDRNDREDTYDLASRIKLAVNFDSVGTGAASMLIASSDNDAVLTSKYARTMGANFSSSFVSKVLSKNSLGMDEFDGLNSLSLVTFGQLKNQANIADTVENLGEEHIRELAAKKANMIGSVISYFGEQNLDKLNSKSDAVYYSVIGLFTVSYPVFVSFILGGVLALLLALAILVSILKKAYNFSALARGVITQILSIAATVLAMFVLYFLIAAILSGLGVISLQGILTLTYYNTGIMIGFTLFGLAMQAVFYNLLKNMLSVKATDIARGGAVIFMVLALVLSFVYPAISYMFVIPAIFAAAVMLITSLIKGKYREKTNQDIERLLLYLIPIAISLPLMIPTLAITASILPLVFLPLILLPIILSAGLAAPYIMALKPFMSRQLLKLPKRTIRVERTVTEQIEDPAKKGKFTEVTHKVINKEKTHWKYRHGAVMSIIAVISAVIIMISASTARPLGAPVYGFETYGNNFTAQSMFDDSIIVSWSHLGGALGSTDTNLMIKDQAMYEDLNTVISGYDWNAEKGAYIKKFNWTSLVTPIISGENNLITIKPATIGTTCGIPQLTIRRASAIKSLLITDRGKKAVMEIDNTQRKDNLTLQFPHNEWAFTEFYIKVEFFDGENRGNLDIMYHQFVWLNDINFLLPKISDFELAQNFDSSVRFGVYYEYELDLNIS